MSIAMRQPRNPAHDEIPAANADPAEPRDVLPFPRESSSTIVCASQAMRQILEQVEWFAQSDAPVLVTGESGTGKEVIARLVHQQSRRAGHRYVSVNCAALSESLIESELFGHERGAFTGACEVRMGRFEWAGEGTLLLDEISEISPTLQAKLLRVLEEEEFQRVGSNRPLPMRARIVATSNRNLQQEVAAGRFREDLYFRLNVLQVQLPPLRERPADIPPMIQYFIELFRHEGRGSVSDVGELAMRQLTAYSWPGNVRQLRNFVRRLCVMCADATVNTQDLIMAQLPVHESSTEEPPTKLMDMTLREVERVLIRHAIARSHGNRTAAAKQLGVTSRTLHNRLKQDPDLLRGIPQ
jgi:transcriptional regulator with PAS, ATPase and Fis domain